MKSKIFLDSLVYNKKKHWLANEHYHLVYLQKNDYNFIPILLTDRDIINGIIRAQKNPEDAPLYKENNLFIKLKNLYNKLITYFHWI